MSDDRDHTSPPEHSSSAPVPSGPTPEPAPPSTVSPSNGIDPVPGAHYATPGHPQPPAGESPAAPGQPDSGPYGPAPYTVPPTGPGQPWHLAGGQPPPYVHSGHPGTVAGSGGPKRWLALAAAALALVLAGGVVGGLIVSTVDDNTAVSSPVVSSNVSSKQGSLADMVAQVQPSVVSLVVTTAQSQDEGSGVIIRSDGMILTNDHVVSDAANGAGTIQVTFSDGRKATAKIVGADQTGDLAVIKADGVSGLKPATLGDSSKLRVGDGVVAIGSPLGLEGSVTQGIVSALNRSYQVSADQQQQQQQNPFSRNQRQQQSAAGTITIPNAIQTDAAINPGNSGGPLLNLSGQVVGINSAIRSADNAGNGQAGSIGIGFAIPINTAHQTAETLIKSGKVDHPYLGVEVQSATGDNQNGGTQTQGAIVASVAKGGPADAAGLLQGDVITRVDNTSVDSADDVVTEVQKHKPGDKITIGFTRNGQAKTATVTLGKSPS